MAGNCAINASHMSQMWHQHTLPLWASKDEYEKIWDALDKNK